MQSGAFTGQLLYDRDGQTYTAPYHSLGTESYRQFGFGWGESDSLKVFGAFSLPTKGENQRGYVSYCVKETRDGCILDYGSATRTSEAGLSSRQKPPRDTSRGADLAPLPSRMWTTQYSSTHSENSSETFSNIRTLISVREYLQRRKEFGNGQRCK